MQTRTEEEWIRLFEAKKAFWRHDGNIKRPHALLTSGMHTKSVFNGNLVIADEDLLCEIASNLVSALQKVYHLDIDVVDRVVGPETGGRKLAERISTRIADLRGWPCQWAAPTKDITDDQKIMVFSDHDRRVENGEVVLVCDDTLTTVAVEKMGGCALPFSPVIMRWLGVAMLHGNSIVSLVQMSHRVWTAQECPLCRVGSVALRPKQSENWEMLNAPY